MSAFRFSYQRAGHADGRAGAAESAAAFSFLGGAAFTPPRSRNFAKSAFVIGPRR